MKSNALLIALLTTSMLIIGCSTDERATSNQTGMVDTSRGPDSEVRGVTISLYDKRMVTTRIHAETIHDYDEADSTMAYQLDIDLFDTLGQLTTHIVGDSGIIRENTNILLLYGQVVVRTADSTKLETDFLRWNPNLNKIQTDAFVRITQRDNAFTGWGLEADRELSRIKILSEVSGSVEGASRITEQ